MATNVFQIPKAQTLRFFDPSKITEVQTADNRSIYEFEYPNTLPYTDVYKHKQSDPLWSQFRTNYSSFSAYLVDENENKIDITGQLTLLFVDLESRSYYNLDIPISDKLGCYYIEYSGSEVGKPAFQRFSDYFEVLEEVPNTLLIEWRGNLNGYDDQMDWVNHSLKQNLRVSASDRDLEADQNKSVYDNSSYAPLTLKSKPIRKMILNINRLHQLLVEKINIALSHDEFYVNNVQYNTDSSPESEILGDTMQYKGTITLTQINFEDGEDEEVTGIVETAFLKINDTDFLLINDSGDRLKISN